MYLVQILLPLYDNTGAAQPAELFQAVGAELHERFGGLTAFTRAPAEGVWSGDEHGAATRDDIVIFEVMAEGVDRPFWRGYRAKLEQRFRQRVVVIRVQQIDLI